MKRRWVGRAVVIGAAGLFGKGGDKPAKPVTSLGMDGGAMASLSQRHGLKWRIRHSKRSYCGSPCSLHFSMLGDTGGAGAAGDCTL
jgi:hypothetical protein